MIQSYRIQVRCPEGDFYKWMMKDDVNLSLIEVLMSRQDFVCPVHGPQCARPFQAEVKKAFVDEKPTRTRLLQTPPRVFEAAD